MKMFAIKAACLAFKKQVQENRLVRAKEYIEKNGYKLIVDVAKLTDNSSK